MSKNQKTSWKFKLSLIGCLLLVLVGGAIWKVSRDLARVANQTNQTIEVANLRKKSVNLEEGEPLNVLLIGTDDDLTARKEGEGYVGRADTLMILSINPQTRSTKMVSIPRDTYTFIKGQSNPDKINHSYAFGGIELTVDTVQNYLNLPIDYYAAVNMDGLANLIDALGGIEVTSPLTFEYRNTMFKKGETRHVNGVKALNFARMRYDDPLGEVGRQNRQKIVIKAIVDKVLSMDSLTNYPQILKAVEDNVRTNLSIQTALKIMKQYTPAAEKMTIIKFDDLEELYIDDVFYFHIPLSARLKVTNELRQQSSLPLVATKDLADPIGDEAGDTTITKISNVVLNQYPTGLTEEQQEDIINQQQVIQTHRAEESYIPAQSVEEYQPAPNYQPSYQPEYRPQPQYTPPASSGGQTPQPQPPAQSAPPVQSEPPAQPAPQPQPEAPTEPQQPQPAPQEPAPQPQLEAPAGSTEE